jgi:hypothetical protein
MTVRNPLRNPPSIVTRAAYAAQLRQSVNLLRTLSRAQEVVADPSAWTRGALARTVLRTAVLPTCEDAQCWSASGALVLASAEVLGAFASRSDRERLYDLSLRTLWECLPTDHPRSERVSLDVDGFNDYPGTAHEDITALFERAVERARGLQLELARP